MINVSAGEHCYEESLRDTSGLLSLTEEDKENQDILKPEDLCIFKKNISMGKKDKTVRTIFNLNQFVYLRLFRIQSCPCCSMTSTERWK